MLLGQKKSNQCIPKGREKKGAAELTHFFATLLELEMIATIIWIYHRIRVELDFNKDEPGRVKKK